LPPQNLPLEVMDPQSFCEAITPRTHDGFGSRQPSDAFNFLQSVNCPHNQHLFATALDVDPAKFWFRVGRGLVPSPLESLSVCQWPILKRGNSIATMSGHGWQGQEWTESVWGKWRNRERSSYSSQHGNSRDDVARSPWPPKDVTPLPPASIESASSSAMPYVLGTEPPPTSTLPHNPGTDHRMAHPCSPARTHESWSSSGVFRVATRDHPRDSFGRTGDAENPARS